MEKIKGLIDAPFTPFYENGEVNYEPIEAYAKLLVKNGLKGVFINGSSGEGYMLTDEERMKLAERWVEVAPDGFKVIVHVGSTCVKSSHKLAAHAQKIGAWGNRRNGLSFPESEPDRRIGEILRRNRIRRSGTSFLLLSHPGFQRCFPADGRTAESGGRAYTKLRRYQIHIRKPLRIQPVPLV